MFKPVSSGSSVVDRCASAIEHAIVSGELGIGERLPPERRLAEQFEVNRLTIRVALSKLSSAGLLRVRQGSGYVVQDFVRRAGPDLLTSLVTMASSSGDEAELASDLLLVRRHLARAVFERLTDREEVDLVPIRQAIESFVGQVRAGASRSVLAEADVAVLAAITDATESVVLRLCQNPLMTVMRSFPRLLDALYAQPEGSVEAYQIFLLWLHKRPPSQVDQLLEAMRLRDEATVYALRRSQRGKREQP